MAYVTRAELKTFLGVPSSDTSQDALFDQLVVDASAGVDLWTGRTFAGGVNDATEYYSGNGLPELVLRRRPVALAGLAVNLDSAGYFGQRAGAFNANTLLTLGTEYVLKADDQTGTRSESGLLIWLGGNAISGFPPAAAAGVLTPGAARAGWPAGTGNIRVTYGAGYATVPDAIKSATRKLAATIKNFIDSGTLTMSSRSVGPYSWSKTQLRTLAENTFGSDATDELRRYREVAI